MIRAINRLNDSLLSQIPTCSPNDHVGSVLAKTKSSHEPVFVFENNTFVGLVSPIRSLFYHRYPYLTQVLHCLIHPPHITKSTSLYDIAQYMIDTKMYMLPIFDEQKRFTDIVTVDMIFNHLLKQTILLKRLVDLLTPNTPITAFIHSSVKDIYALMRKKHIGKVILVDEKNKVKGIVSQRDLEDAFIAKTVKQRYTVKEKPPIFLSFDQEKIGRRDAPIMEFATLRVLTASKKMKMELIVKRLLKSDRHSIVVIQDDGTPLGFLSRHDILKAFTQLKPKAEIQIKWTKHASGIRENRLIPVYEIVNQFINKLNKRFPLQRVEVHLDQAKNAAGYPKNLTTVKLHILLKSGKLLISSSQRWKLIDSVRDAIEKIEREAD